LLLHAGRQSIDGFGGMTILSLVVAASRNGVIGKDGGLPWHISSDLKLFKQITMGKPVIMGRKTWDSLPRKPLPGRRNIVISRKSDQPMGGAELARGIDDALAIAKLDDPAEIAVIGGGEIYRLFWPLADQIYLTEVDLEVEGDTSLPKIKPEEWELLEAEAQERGPNDSASFVLKRFKRRKS
jgi:dihydrofolate reductase